MHHSDVTRRNRASAAATRRLETGRSSAAVKGVFWSSANSVIPSLISAGVFLITSRILGPLEFGLVGFAAGIGSFAALAVPIGFGDALIQRSDLDDGHLTSVFWLCLGAAVGAMIVLSVIAIPVATAYHEPILKILVPLLATKTLFDAIGVVPSALLARRMSFALVTVRTTVASVVAALVCLILLALNFGIWALAISQLSASAAGSIAALFSARWMPSRAPSRQAVRELSRYGVFASGTRLLQFIYPEQVLIGALLGPFAVGLYGFARRIFGILSDLIAGSLNAVSRSLFASLQSEREKLREAFSIATFASSAVSFPIFVGLAVVAPDLVPLAFGAKWVPAIIPLQGLCILGLITSIGIIQSSLITSQGRADWWFYYLFAKQVLLLATIGLTYRFGVAGVVWGMVVASLLIWPVTTVKTAQISGISYLNYVRSFASPGIGALVMCGGVLTARHEMSALSPPFRLVCTVILGVALYCPILLITSAKPLRIVRNRILPRRSQ
jgi:teichuronic acid exporter